MGCQGLLGPAGQGGSTLLVRAAENTFGNYMTLICQELVLIFQKILLAIMYMIFICQQIWFWFAKKQSWQICAWFLFARKYDFDWSEIFLTTDWFWIARKLVRTGHWYSVGSYYTKWKFPQSKLLAQQPITFKLLCSGWKTVAAAVVKAISDFWLSSTILSPPRTFLSSAKASPCCHLHSKYATSVLAKTGTC